MLLSYIKQNTHFLKVGGSSPKKILVFLTKYTQFEMTYRNLISQLFPKMIDFEIELYSKAYMYDYNALNYGTYFENKEHFSFFFKDI